MSAERIRSVEAVRDIAEEVGLFLPTAGILYDRGYRTPDEVKRFLSKETEMFHDPFLMKDMKLGAERILSAAEKHEKTVVYGDTMLTELPRSAFFICICARSDAMSGTTFRAEARKDTACLQSGSESLPPKGSRS